MSTYRDVLPQTQGVAMLTDSGIETEIIFKVGRDLPSFALFPLLAEDDGRAILDRYYREHLAVAAEHGLGYVLETPTYRSNPDWGTSLGYSQDALDELDRQGVEFLAEIRDSSVGVTGPMPLSGMLGPRGDGYQVNDVMTADEAQGYHGHQIEVFADAGCDLVSACTLNYAAEGLGIAVAARGHQVPVMLYFTLETDGRLPDGSSLRDTITSIDDETGGSVAYYGINCAHPDHIVHAFAEPGDWTRRVGAIRANASRQSHAELNESDELDSGDPDELAAGYARLRELLPAAAVFGGCCGTGARHIRAIAGVVSQS